MGSFSWLKAERTTKVANIMEGKPFKFLIPEEFGGGFIKDLYQDFGLLGTKEDSEPKYDVYELLALWNYNGPNMITDKYWDNESRSSKEVTFDFSQFPKMKEIDPIYTDILRGMGIEMAYDLWNGRPVKDLKYPLKFVSASYNKTYEETEGQSVSDPNQGWWPYTWDDYDNDQAKQEAQQEQIMADKKEEASLFALALLDEAMKKYTPEKMAEVKITITNIIHRYYEYSYAAAEELVSEIEADIINTNREARKAAEHFGLDYDKIFK